MSTPTPSYTPSGSKPGTSSGPGGPQLLLRRQLQGLVDDSNIMEWEVMIIGPPDTLYEGGIFKARLNFPENFPLYPPEMRFITNMWHPNSTYNPAFTHAYLSNMGMSQVYPDGKVCISILHAPGEDQYGFEQAGERWMPVHTVESISRECGRRGKYLLVQARCVANLILNANNQVQVRNDIAGYRKKVRRLARQAAEEAFE
ncbi:unnamed protein product [Rhizoctonia solani]|uniref:UBC core domain-containing protein n=1 Tax=Rhizoctonia solani TaxID=456999 RepID=A0A8H3C781_9AGAM|nr:unnamed protein product [Rhizoctonia solani]